MHRVACLHSLYGAQYECVSKTFRTGRLERELQMVQLSTTRCSCIAILWVSLVSFAAITLRVASQRVFIVYFDIDSAQKILDTPSYLSVYGCESVWEQRRISRPGRGGGGDKWLEKNLQKVQLHNVYSSPNIFMWSNEAACGDSQYSD
jgi:hypothetical protein